MTSDQEARAAFERYLYCRACGRRLAYVQWEQTSGTTLFEKACPSRDPDHDNLLYEQPFPHRDRRGHLTKGSKRRLVLP